jgi:membrane protease YdiL (CAAX protease family)
MPGAYHPVVAAGGFSLLVAYDRGFDLSRVDRRTLVMLLVGLPLGTALVPVITGSTALLLDLFHITRPPPPPPVTWIVLLVAVLIAPFAEEYVFRERLISALLERSSPFFAIVVSSIAFAVTHTPTWLALGSFALGLLIGLIRVMAGRMSLCVGIHMGFNLTAMMLPYFLCHSGRRF